MKPQKTRRGIRLGIWLLLLCLSVAILVPLWLLRTGPTSVDSTLNETAVEPSVGVTDAVGSGSAPGSEATVPQTTTPGLGTALSGAQAGSATNIEPRQITTVPDGVPVLLGPDGAPSAAYTEFTARALGRAFGDPARPETFTPAAPPDIASLAQTGAAAGAPESTGGPGGESGVDVYRRSDQTRRALVAEMRLVRRAMLIQANRQTSTNQ